MTTFPNSPNRFVKFALAKAAIIGQTNHPESVARIREIEAPKTAPEEGPEIEKQVCNLMYFLLVINN